MDNIDKIKTLEDIKLVVTNMENIKLERTDELLQQFVDKNVADFINYFEQRDFKIEDNHIIDNRVIKVAYGDFDITLVIPDINKRFIGAYTVWELWKQKQRFIISINTLGRKPTITVLMNTINSQDNLDDNIYNVQQRKLQLQSELQQLDKLQFGLRITESNDKLIDAPQYKHIIDIIKVLLEDN